MRTRNTSKRVSQAEQLRLLGQGPSPWNAWKAEHGRVRVNLKGSTLVGLNLRGAELAGAYLEGANLSSCILVDARLSGAVLKKTDLSEAELERADLRDAVLSGSTGHNVNLSHANLVGADLSSVAFARANFDGADLAMADLRSAMFSHATFRGANLTNVLLGATTFSHADLSDVIGLETTLHLGPSSIGVETLYHSPGLPNAFLQGCGVPDQFITAANTTETRFLSCFICYSHSDADFAHELHRRLQSEGIRCWLDEKDLKIGARILDAVQEAIGSHERLLLCCSKASLNSWWVKDEVRKAQERERKDGCQIILPLLLDDHLLTEWADGLASDISSRLAADFRRWRAAPLDFEQQVQRVLNALCL
jgi:uncharacterized protein YjbI with pentapeptide repeats